MDTRHLRHPTRNNLPELRSLGHIKHSVVLQTCCRPMVLRPSKFEGHCPMIRHGCRMALMVALNWSVECVKEES
ncbi:MAG: hypothetical protein BECKG1743E_GA0114224_101765 [Candidatus Kentron sp. G]|nr:MAG: hypothetical protein BECKG1743E_GA0114224_101765 [Candidatus Kentron sp. G]